MHRTHTHAVAVHLPGTTPVALMNLALIASVIAALLFYIIAANGLAALAWRSADAQDKLSGLLEERNGLIAQQSAFEDREYLTTLATNAGFVPSGAVVYLIQDKPVAAR